MVKHKIKIIKSEFKLIVLTNDNAITQSYDVAIGERTDGGPRIYEEDFRTPEGNFHVNNIHKLGSQILNIPNKAYYPFYLAHRMASPFTDLGSDAYGTGIIGLRYPRQEDIDTYHKLLKSGHIQQDWHDFMEEKWRAIFEYVAQTKGIPFKEVILGNEKRTSGKRNFLEGKTFSELYDLTPSQPKLPMAIHGTNDPDCIGHKISGGCVRMHNQDIEELIEKYVEFGMRVDIE